MSTKSELHLICGMAGVGKTTLSRELETSLPAIRLCPDEWIAPLLADQTDRAEMDRVRPIIDALQWTFALRALSLGTNVIWEQGFWHAEERRKYSEAAQAAGAHVVLHYLDVPLAALKNRIAARNRQLPAGSFHIEPGEIDTMMSWFKAPDEEELLLFDEYKTYRSD
jgi:predicted kinase